MLLEYNYKSYIWPKNEDDQKMKMATRVKTNTKSENPLTLVTQLYPLRTSRKKPECSICLGLVVAAR